MHRGSCLFEQHTPIGRPFCFRLIFVCDWSTREVRNCVVHVPGPHKSTHSIAIELNQFGAPFVRPTNRRKSIHLFIIFNISQASHHVPHSNGIGAAARFRIKKFPDESKRP